MGDPVGMPRSTTVQQPQAAMVSNTHVPPLKWAGGKRWLRDTLAGLYQDHQHRRLVEPFAGGLAITLGLAPKQALVNDINPHLVNFYKHLRAGLVLDVDRRNEETVFYANRAAFNELIRQGRAVGMHADGRRAAMLFYYLNRHCYNGLCRFNRSGGFNTPFGTYVNPKYEVDLTAYKPILKGWEFTCGDFEDVAYESGDFVYADPPYDEAFTGYAEQGFGWDGQERLAEFLAGHDGPVVISNHATKRIEELYRSHGFDVSRKLEAPRMIHCFGDRRRALEIVATKNL